MFADIASGHTFAADVCFLVAVIVCALALMPKRLDFIGEVALPTIALGAVALGLLLL
jgi:hypothetical protein